MLLAFYIVNTLIGPERRPMDENISAALQSGMIRPLLLTDWSRVALCGPRWMALSHKRCLQRANWQHVKHRLPASLSDLVEPGSATVLSKLNVCISYDHITLFLTYSQLSIIKFWRSYFVTSLSFIQVSCALHVVRYRSGPMIDGPWERPSGNRWLKPTSRNSSLALISIRT